MFVKGLHVEHCLIWYKIFLFVVIHIITVRAGNGQY
jgi:hypothetical protein